MANMRALRTRIKSVESTRQITKSMKMVAASKLRRTQLSINTMRIFADKCSSVLSDVAAESEASSNPFLCPRAERKNVCYVVFLGNRGLCGNYNHGLVRFLQEKAAEDGRECFMVPCGRWGKDILRATGIRIQRIFDEVSDTPDFSQSREISQYLKELYLSGQADELVLVYQQYKTVLQQEPCIKQLLPIVPIGGESESAETEFEFEPDRDSVLNELTEMYIDNTVYSVLLESKAGEHSARMSAMTAASDNTDELIAQLSKQLNHARQAAITTEISEIVGGAAALEKKE